MLDPGRGVSVPGLLPAELRRRSSDELNAALGGLPVAAELGRHVGLVHEDLMPDVGHVTCEIELVNLLRMPADKIGETVGGQFGLCCDPWTHTDITELAGSPELSDLVDGEHAVLAVLGGQERERERSMPSEWAYHAPVLT